MTITNRQYEAAFAASEGVHTKKFSTSEAVQKVHQDSGMDEANARHYIAAYVAMRSGEPYTYSIKDSAVEHALRELFETEGQKGLALAINAVDGYLKNYMRIKGVERRSLKDLILPWRRKIT